MQTATQTPAETAPRNPAPPRPQTLVQTAAIKLDTTTAHATSAPQAAGGPCRNCQSPEPWGTSAWCPRCGFYPKLGICIPVDAIQSLHEEEDLGNGEIPRWMWGLGIGGAAILIVSIIARMQVPDDGPKTLWTIAQVSLGLCLLLAAHIQAYYLSGSKNDKLGIFDMIAAPAAVWRGVVEALPDTGWLVTRGGWGVGAILCGFLVVGGLSWDEINAMIAAKAEGQQKLKPLAVIAGMAKGKARPKAGGPENVEDAMNAFIEELGVQDLANGGLGAPVAEEPGGLRKQCAIVGYTKNIDGDLKSVLLATVSAGQPTEYVAKVPVTKLPGNVASRLASVLPDMRTSRPAVDCPVKAYWVKPELTCMMSFEEGAEEGNWSNVKFVELLNAAGVSFDAEQTAEVLGDTQQLLEQSLPELQNALGGN